MSRGMLMSQLLSQESLEVSEILSKKVAEKFPLSKLHQLRLILNPTSNEKAFEKEKEKEKEDERSIKDGKEEEVQVETSQEPLRKRKRSASKCFYFGLFQETGIENEYLCPFVSFSGKQGTHYHSEKFKASRTNRFVEHMDTWHEDIQKFIVNVRRENFSISNDWLVSLVLQKFGSSRGTILPFTKKMDLFSLEWEKWIYLVLWISTKNISFRSLDDVFLQKYYLSMGNSPLPSREKVFLIYWICSY